MDSIQDIPDCELYRPLFSPWHGRGEFQEVYAEAAPYTLVSVDRCYVLYTLGRQALSLVGDFWECGVYRGGTAILLNCLLDRFEPCSSRLLHIFDTFSGTPAADPSIDIHKQYDFRGDALAIVQARLPNVARVSAHPGVMPNTFASLEANVIALAHIDVDIRQSVAGCCSFIYPRLVAGGFMVFDDYGFPKCPGARRAVDEFFSDKREFPLVLQTGQAVVHKLD